MNWDLEQVRAFVAAADKGSFSAAARHLGKAQSRVSTAVANLELDLGVELFDRSRRLPVLTHAGAELLEDARLLLNQSQRLQARAGEYSQGSEISLQLAVDESMMITLQREFFQDFASQFPRLKLTLINGSQSDITQWVSRREADLGLTFYPKRLYAKDEQDSLQYSLLSQFRQCLIVAKSHSLARIEKIDLEHLQAYRQLLICDQQGKSGEQIVSSDHWFIDSYYSIIELVVAGLGWAIVPEHLAESEWYRAEMQRIPADSLGTSMLTEVALVKRRDRGKGPAIDWFYQHAAKLFNRDN